MEEASMDVDGPSGLTSLQLKEAAMDVVDPSSLTSETNMEFSKEGSAVPMSPGTSQRQMVSSPMKTILLKTPRSIRNPKGVHFSNAVNVSVFNAKSRIPSCPATPSLKTDEGAQSTSKCQFSLLFKEPSSRLDFYNKLHIYKVSLENFAVNDLKMSGTVMVRNLGDDQQVIIRYTVTKWKTYTDHSCDYDDLSHDGYFDRFLFTILLPNLCPDQYVTFAIKYVVNGWKFWDDNFKRNYRLRSKQA